MTIPLQGSTLLVMRHKVNTHSPRWIYALVDPRDSRVRYIGCSVDPEKRLRDHMATVTGLVASMLSRHDSPTPVYTWLFHLVQNGELPLLVFIEQCAADVWRERESYWIVKLDEAGADLTNIYTTAEYSNLRPPRSKSQKEWKVVSGYYFILSNGRLVLKHR